MVLISFTNVVVDEFGYGKGTENVFIYFLTHWHSDHYHGIYNAWKKGRIYCSEVTRRLMLCKYPRLEPLVQSLELNTPHIIKLKGDIEIKVQLFDSNHIAGSVMILFEGYFGRILHSGDLRFHQNIIKMNPYLFPRTKQEDSPCSLKIDQLILDNTYCDPIFKFPLRSTATQLISQIIDRNPNKRVFLATDSIGKQQAFVSLSKHYNTQIHLNRQRYNYIKCMNIDPIHFTTRKQDSWIEVIKKHQKEDKMQEYPKSICITMTGWANITTYYQYNPREFIVPYSLHSNFIELDSFVKAIRPGVIKPIVKSKANGWGKINNIKQFSAYMNTGMHLHQRGLEYFQENYSSYKHLSQEYKSLLDDSERQLKLNQELGLVIDVTKRKVVEESEEEEIIDEEERDKD